MNFHVIHPNFTINVLSAMASKYLLAHSEYTILLTLDNNIDLFRKYSSISYLLLFINLREDYCYQ